MAKISRDRATPVGGTEVLHPRETVIIGGNIGAVNAEIVLAVDGCSTFSIDLRGTFSGTFEASGTIDGTNYTPIPVRPINVAAIAYVAAITGTAAGVWVGKCAPYRSIRLRCTAYTSGAAVATLAADNGVLDDSLQGMVTTGIVTATAASGVTITATVPNPGAGLRNYITYVRITRFAAAALTAAATPVLVTTSNLPGAPVFSFPAEAAAQGTVFLFGEDFAYPLASSAQNATTTVVAPAATGVIWRLTVGYYVAP